MYTVVISQEALNDIGAVYKYIAYELMAPLTALRYREGLVNTIRRLASTADIYAFSQNDYIRAKYGLNARHVVYKRMVIIYIVHHDKVIICGVVPSPLIR